MSDIINSQILETFLMPFSAAQKTKIIASFISEMPERAENCVTFFHDKNYAELRIEAHTLKSLAKTVGANNLAEQSFHIENLCNQENHHALSSDQVDLIALTGAVCDILAKI